MDEWIIRVLKPMYDNVQSNVRVSNRYTKPIKFSFGVHQGHALSQLLFIIVMETFTPKFSWMLLGVLPSNTKKQIHTSFKQRWYSQPVYEVKYCMEVQLDQ